jgi:phage terminase Nu1 subunit (DNA packaging protein)
MADGIGIMALAEFLHRDYRTVKRWARAGSIVGQRGEDGRLYFNQAAIQRAIRFSLLRHAELADPRRGDDEDL